MDNTLVVLIKIFAEEKCRLVLDSIAELENVGVLITIVPVSTFVKVFPFCTEVKIGR